CVAQAFFCLAALTAVVTSRWWVESAAVRSSPDPRLFKLATVLVLVVYLQLVVGAVMRHYRAGLAIPDLPLAYGRLLPPFSARSLEAVNEFRTWDARLERVTLGQIWLHFTHRLGAIAVTVAAAALVLRIVRRRRRALFGAAALLSA